MIHAMGPGTVRITEMFSRVGCRPEIGLGMLRLITVADLRRRHQSEVISSGGQINSRYGRLRAKIISLVVMLG